MAIAVQITAIICGTIVALVYALALMVWIVGKYMNNE